MWLSRCTSRIFTTLLSPLPYAGLLEILAAWAFCIEPRSICCEVIYHLDGPQNVKSPIIFYNGT